MSNQLLDLSRPEIKQAYLMGIEAGRLEMAAHSDRLVTITETRIIRELDRFERELIARRSTSRARVISMAIARIKGEEWVDND